MRTCSINGCDNIWAKRQWCNMHYRRWYKHGDPNHVEQIRDGHSKHPLWGTYRNMIARCNEPLSPEYSYYGSRGISICDRWLNSFDDFVADVGERPTGKTLDRIDNSGNYEPANIRWATRRMQTINQRKSSRNTSGYVGVQWYKAYKKWVANINVDGRNKCLGYFVKLEDAIAARKDAENIYYLPLMEMK